VGLAQSGDNLKPVEKEEQEKVHGELLVEETPEKPIAPEEQPVTSEEEVEGEQLPEDVKKKLIENILKAGGNLLYEYAKSIGATEEEAVEMLFDSPEIDAIYLTFKEDLDKIPPTYFKVMILIPIIAKRGMIFIRASRRKRIGGVKVEPKPEPKAEQKTPEST
jgi:hypothetical protein